LSAFARDISKDRIENLARILLLDSGVQSKGGRLRRLSIPLCYCNFQQVIKIGKKDRYPYKKVLESFLWKCGVHPWQHKAERARLSART
jgi:hypothetical protein